MSANLTLALLHVCPSLAQNPAICGDQLPGMGLSSLFVRRVSSLAGYAHDPAFACRARACQRVGSATSGRTPPAGGFHELVPPEAARKRPRQRSSPYPRCGDGCGRRATGVPERRTRRGTRFRIVATRHPWFVPHHRDLPPRVCEILLSEFLQSSHSHDTTRHSRTVARSRV
jgi:hypothetical protein